MNNDETNQKITELENKYLRLIKTKAIVDIEITEINLQIKQHRRSFKLEGYNIRTKRVRLSTDAKKMFLDMKEHICECGCYILLVFLCLFFYFFCHSFTSWLKTFLFTCFF